MAELLRAAIPAELPRHERVKLKQRSQHVRHKSSQWRPRDPARWTKCVECLRPKLGFCKLAMRATQRTGPQVRLVGERAGLGMAQCDRPRLQKDGTACLISRQPPRFLSLFLFITRNLMSSNCMAACKASWRSLVALTSSSLSMMAAGILLTSC